MAKNTTKKAAATKSSSGYWADRKAAKEKAIKDFGGLAFHLATVGNDVKRNGEVAVAKGGTVEVHAITVNKWLTPQAICYKPGETPGDDVKPLFVDPGKLTKGKAMDKAKVARLQSEREEANSATVLVPGTVRRQTDSGIMLAYHGWMKAIFFTPTMIVKREGTMPRAVGDTTIDLDIFEVPAWKVKQEVGQDALDALLAKQDDIGQHVAD